MATKVAISFLNRASRINALSRNTRSFHNRMMCGITTPIHGIIRQYNTEKPAAAQHKSGNDDSSISSDLGDMTENEKKLAIELEAIKLEMHTLKEQNENILDKYKRSLADSENLRVRLTKQIEDAKIYGIQGFCKDLLEVADTLGHATQSVPQEAINDKNPQLKSLYEGLSMTRACLLQVFKRHGLEPINPLNEKFNPNVHEALYQKDDNSVDPNTVIEVTKLGYKLHDRCIRPALVGVSKSS